MKIMTKDKSVLPAGLIEAYKMTNFEVLAKPPFILKVGSHSAELKSLFADTKLETGCFITAYNPFSEPLSVEMNMDAQENLKQKLHGLGLPVLEGLGSDPSGEWEGEPSVFILGISCADAKNLGVEFKQNAIVWCDANCTPELLLLR